ncbi:MAG TPA: hypothetical protein VKQ54_16400 [Caulobacteraceae bacterium]|nr:hypothetical protein [Caulobacteraceae bacterium]
MHKLLAGVAALAIAVPLYAFAQSTPAKSTPAKSVPAKTAPAAAPAASASTGSPFDGTWKTNPRSTVYSGKPAEYDVSGGMYSCASCAPPVKVKADGTPQPIAGNPFIDTLAVTVVDDHTLKSVGAKGGKTRGEQTFKVAADGKTMTVSFQGRALNPGAAPVGITRTYTRLTDAPAGAHAVSGTWKRTAATAMSGAAGVDTFKMEGGMLHWSSPGGQSYVAALDGKPYPIKGDPGADHVTLKKVSDHKIVETDWRKGKKIDTTTWSVSPSGKTLTILDDDPETGVIATSKAMKQ